MISKYENENLKKSTVGICNIINLFVYGMRKSVSSREIWKLKWKEKKNVFGFARLRTSVRTGTTRGDHERTEKEKYMVGKILLRLIDTIYHKIGSICHALDGKHYHLQKKEFRKIWALFKCLRSL